MKATSKNIDAQSLQDILLVLGELNTGEFLRELIDWRDSEECNAVYYTIDDVIDLFLECCE